MACITRMSSLSPPLTTAFGVIGLFLAVMAFSLNFIVLYIIRRFNNKRQKRHKILISLAVADMLSGCVLLPMLSIQLLHTEFLMACSYDNIRSYLSALLIGCSSLSLGMISIDRYLLLTKLHNYNRYMTKRMTYIMIACCWLLPAVTPVFRYVTYALYQILMALIFALPFVVLLVCYILISRAVRQAANNLEQQTNKLYPVETSDKGGLKTSKSRPGRDSEVLKTPLKRPIQNGRDSTATKQNINKQNTNVKLAKAAALLIICYFLCVFPTVIWIFFEFFDTDMSTISPYNKEVFYLLSMMLCLTNSVINPLIYFIKTPEFRRSFKVLFRRTEVHSISSYEGETTAYPSTIKLPPPPQTIKD